MVLLGLGVIKAKRRKDVRPRAALLLMRQNRPGVLELHSFQSRRPQNFYAIVPILVIPGVTLSPPPQQVGLTFQRVCNPRSPPPPDNDTSRGSMLSLSLEYRL